MLSEVQLFYTSDSRHRWNWIRVLLHMLGVNVSHRDGRLGWFNTNSVAFQLFVSSPSIQSMPAQTLPVPHTVLPWKRGKNQGKRQSLYPCLLPGKPTNRCKVKTVKRRESFCFSLYLCMCGWDSIPPSGNSNKDFRIL